MENAAGVLVDTNTLMNKLNRLLRNAGTTPATEIITTCQAIKSNISFIEDWAFQQGEVNE
jgi:hypothetical protein